MYVLRLKISVKKYIKDSTFPQMVFNFKFPSEKKSETYFPFTSASIAIIFLLELWFFWLSIGMVALLTDDFLRMALGRDSFAYIFGVMGCFFGWNSEFSNKKELACKAVCFFYKKN